MPHHQNSAQFFYKNLNFSVRVFILFTFLNTKIQNKMSLQGYFNRLEHYVSTEDSRLLASSLSLQDAAHVRIISDQHIEVSYLSFS